LVDLGYDGTEDANASGNRIIKAVLKEGGKTAEDYFFAKNSVA
jgi:hypothetical protein